MGESSACTTRILETIPNLTTLCIPGKAYAIGFPSLPAFATMGLLYQLHTQDESDYVE
jgi:hypothetical protein